MQANLTIHPDVLIRVAGGDFDSFEGLNLHSTMRLIEESFAEKRQNEVHKNKLSADLFLIIQNCQDDKVRNALINIKRDLFNLRVLSPEQEQQIATAVSDEKFQVLLFDFHRAVRTMEDKRMEIEKSYNHEITINRNRVVELSTKDNFQKGLVLSSIVFYDEMPRYISNTSVSLNKKLNHTELSIVKYLSRIYSKTSPFSTFTNLCLGKVSNEKFDSDIFFKASNSKKLAEVSSYVKLNNLLYKYLRELMIKDIGLAKGLGIRLNPTLKIKDSEYLFLVNSNNEESFQRISRNKFLDIIIETLSKPKKEIKFESLVERMCNLIEIEAGELITQLNTLIDFGFLEFNIGVSGIDPNWDIKLIKKLKALPGKSNFSLEIINALQILRQSARNYARQSSKERRSILTNSYSTYKELHDKLTAAINSIPNQKEESRNQTGRDGEAGSFIFKKKLTGKMNLSAEKMFYEDTLLPMTADIQHTFVGPVIFSLNRLLQLLKFSENARTERLKMYHYFCKKYPSDSSIDLLTFYENYYRDYKKPERDYELVKRSQSHVADMQLPQIVAEIKENSSIRNRERLWKDWQDKLIMETRSQMDKTNDTISLSSDLLEKINRELFIDCEMQNPNVQSHGAFFQFSEDGKAVVNAVFIGYGKMFSRFLHMLDDRVYNKLVANNISLIPQDALFVENTDGSYFNGNIHPPLLEKEVVGPGGNNGLHQRDQISITELEVIRNFDKEELILYHKASKKRIYVFDLCFEGSLGRAPLFQLLNYFSYAENVNLTILNPAINTAFQSLFTSKEIAIFPRIIFDNKLILQRKCWIVPIEKLCIKSTSDTDAVYFVKINEWRLENGLPMEVFIRLNFAEEIAEKNHNQKRPTRDDYKPQYINFQNPVLVKLFNKLVAKTSFFIKMEEMAPSSNSLLKINEKRYVTEFSMQWQA